MNYPQWLETLIDKIYDAGVEDGSIGNPYEHDPRNEAAQAIQARFERALSADEKSNYGSGFLDRNELRAEARKRWQENEL